MNILAIDHGTKRLGLAWADDTMGFVLPFGIVTQDTHEQSHVPKELVDRIKEERIDLIIVGIPFTAHDGSENEHTAQVKNFVVRLQSLVSIPVKEIDERFSSKQADQMGGAATRDEKSAMVILQSYLDSKK